MSKYHLQKHWIRTGKRINNAITTGLFRIPQFNAIPYMKVITHERNPKVSNSYFI